MKIYTKTGDSGTSGIIGGDRLSKDDAIFEAYGTLDEFNGHLGLVHSILVKESLNDLAKIILLVQSEVFSAGSLLATPPTKRSPDTEKAHQSIITVLEQEIDKMETELPELKNFILPGGSLDSGFVQVARAVARRAERNIIHLYLLKPDWKISNLAPFINRLSDFLFVLARYVNFKVGGAENIWTNQRQERV